MHQNITRNGIEKSRMKPWKIETAEYCSPEDSMIIGKVVSMDVTPPDEIGARGPKALVRTGDKSRVTISRMILASNAIVPSSAPLYSVMKMLERE